MVTAVEHVLLAVVVVDWKARNRLCTKVVSTR